ncbi:hypothetical protein [Nonomuraea glycinis]|uniref:hypothetical protein n=1 Tax=Nonomuraea glycinis TaxID=2047744 RepID=UPI0033A7080A
MGILGFFLALQGFGGLVAAAFGRHFGLLHLWVDGGAHTALSLGLGLLGLVLLGDAVRRGLKKS